MPVPKPVYIRWVDSASLGDSNWMLIEDFAPMSQTICQSLGWIVNEDEDSVYLAGHISPDEFGNLWQIPKGAIRELKYLTF